MEALNMNNNVKLQLINYLYREEINNLCDFLAGDNAYLSPDPTLGNITLKDTRSSYEEGYDYRWTVYYFEDWNAYVEFYGYYTSYDGLDCDECYLVEPEEYVAVRYNKCEIVPEPIKSIDDLVSSMNDWIIRNNSLDDLCAHFAMSSNGELVYQDGISQIFKLNMFGTDDYIGFYGYDSSFSGFIVETVKKVFPKQQMITIFE